MVFSGTIVSEAEIALMAGENVNSTGDTEANRNLLVTHAESYLSGLVKFDIVTAWATINAKTRAIFSEWAARYAGSELILFNPAGYTSRIEAEDKVNVHLFRMKKIEETLSDASVEDFMEV